TCGSQPDAACESSGPPFHPLRRPVRRLKEQLGRFAPQLKPEPGLLTQRPWEPISQNSPCHSLLNARSTIRVKRIIDHELLRHIVIVVPRNLAKTLSNGF